MIAFVIRELDIRGGTHKQFLELLNYADERGEDYIVITSSLDLSRTYPGFSRFKDKIKVIGDVNRYNFVKQMFVMRRLIREADVINVHESGFEKIYAAFLGKRVVVQINDLPSVFREGANKNLKRSFAGWLVAMFIRFQYRLFVSAITVNVGKNSQRVQKCLGASSKVLHCGISPVGIEHKNCDSLTRFRARKVRLLSSGVFFPYRNYETLVSAVGILKLHGVDVLLKIFGSYKLCPEYFEKIKNQIKKEKLDECVQILGQVDEAEYRMLHEESDIFCFVNIDQSWGLSIFEALSAGLPVIVGNSVGGTEILHDQVDALFVNPTEPEEIAQAVESLMCDMKRYERIQESGLRLVTEYSWKGSYCKPMFDILFE